MRTVNPPDAPEAVGYSQATVMGGLVFVSGQVGVKPDGTLAGTDVASQTEQIYANLRAVLEASGSSMAHVGKLTVLITDISARPIIAEIRNRVFAPFGFAPAATLAVVAGLARPEWLVEIEAIAELR